FIGTFFISFASFCDAMDVLLNHKLGNQWTKSHILETLIFPFSVSGLCLLAIVLHYSTRERVTLKRSIRIFIIVFLSTIIITLALFLLEKLFLEHDDILFWKVLLVFSMFIANVDINVKLCIMVHQYIHHTWTKRIMFGLLFT